MTRALALLLSVAAGCTVPDLHSGNLQCAAGKQCPEGFHCADDDRCWQDGSDPDLAVSGNDDLSAPVDMAVAVDLADADLRPSTHDLAEGDALIPSKCAASTALLCDNFEAEALDAQWISTLNNGTATIDTSRAYRGARALHLHTGVVPDGGGAEASVEETRTFPQNKTIYLRVWVYIQSPYPVQAFDQFINFVDTGTAGIAYVLLNGLPLLNAYTTPNVFKAATAPPIPLDRWTCLAMSVTQPGATGTVHIMVDGTDSDATSGGVATTQMAGVHLGLQFNGGGPGFGAADVWLDEVIVDTNPIGCSD